MTDEYLKKLIRLNPDSIYAHAYRLGRKEANIELQKSIEKARVK